VKSVPHSLSFQRKEFGISCSPTITAKEYFSYQHVETVLPLLRYLDTILLIPDFVTLLPASVKRFGIAVINKQRF
jgi:hypothetical protein